MGNRSRYWLRKYRESNTNVRGLRSQSMRAGGYR